jgi:hypothetical protein
MDLLPDRARLTMLLVAMDERQLRIDLLLPR